MSVVVSDGSALVGVRLGGGGGFGVVDALPGVDEVGAGSFVVVAEGVAVFDDLAFDVGEGEGVGEVPDAGLEDVDGVGGCGWLSGEVGGLAAVEEGSVEAGGVAVGSVECCAEAAFDAVVVAGGGEGEALCAEVALYAAAVEEGGDRRGGGGGIRVGLWIPVGLCCC